MKQIDAVYNYIVKALKTQKKVTTWELEENARFMERFMSAGSATRHARTLCKQGIIEHPCIQFKEDIHSYILCEKITRQELLEKVNEAERQYKISEGDLNNEKYIL